MTPSEIEAATSFLKSCEYVEAHLDSLRRLFTRQIEDFTTIARGLREENEELKVRIKGLEK